MSEPSAASSHRTLHLRANLYSMIRAFFAARSMLEVDTPILGTAGNTAPNIKSFCTVFNGHIDAGARERWLRTSPEHAMKRLLASGVGDCYELGRVFRDGEAGRQHNPEFTLLEWYRVGWDHRQLIAETCELIGDALRFVGRSVLIDERSYREWFIDQLGIDPFSASLEQLQARLSDVRITADGLDRDDWLDLLVTHRLQPAFAPDRISVIRDFPASQCALARIRDDDPPVAERFEVYLGAYELANGYHELTDGDEQRARFERDNRRRCERGQRPMPIDEQLIDALVNLPPCAGVALGVDRLLMCMANLDDLRDVLAFPFAVA